jgi:hypothetical protein
MANLEKHKKNTAMEWLEAEESDVPTHPRSRHVIDSYVKNRKVAARRSRPARPKEAAQKPEVSLMREPAPAAKSGRPSPLSSADHLRKLGRRPQLRAPYQYNKGR